MQIVVHCHSQTCAWDRLSNKSAKGLACEALLCVRAYAQVVIYEFVSVIRTLI